MRNDVLCIRTDRERKRRAVSREAAAQDLGVIEHMRALVSFVGGETDDAAARPSKAQPD